MEQENKILTKIYGLLKHIKGVTQSFSVEIALADVYDQQGMYEDLTIVMYPKQSDRDPLEMTLSISMLESMDLGDVLEAIEKQSLRSIVDPHEGNETLH